MTTNPKSNSLKLTRKQKAFADTLLANPKMSATQAAHLTYNSINKKTSSVIATENLAKPSIQVYLEKHADTALQDNIEIAKYAKEYGMTGDKQGASYASVAMNINKDILDRTYGKAKQQVDINSTAVSLTIDLTSALSGEENS